MHFLMYQLYKINDLPSSYYKVIWGPPVLCLLLYCHILIFCSRLLSTCTFLKGETIGLRTCCPFILA